tara:strand:- start:10 stop:132 length:123 start_codon:yes stop_codon:yes gene_type:complete
MRSKATESKPKKRKGIHSKKRTSNNKQSKFYAKKYRGQGR